MTLYHKWDVKFGFNFALIQFFMLISGGLGGVLVIALNIYWYSLEHSMQHFVAKRESNDHNSYLNMNITENSVIQLIFE